MNPCAATASIPYTSRCPGTEGLHSHVDKTLWIFFQQSNQEICASSQEVIPCRICVRDVSEYTAEIVYEIESYFSTIFIKIFLH